MVPQFIAQNFSGVKAPAEGVTSIDQNTSDGESNSFHFSHSSGCSGAELLVL